MQKSKGLPVIYEEKHAFLKSTSNSRFYIYLLLILFGCTASEDSGVKEESSEVKQWSPDDTRDLLALPWQGVW